MKKKGFFYFVFICLNLTINAQVNLDSGLVAYYPFNGNANDESGNGNNGTVTGATLTTDRYENSNSAFIFNGESDVITIPHSNSLDITEAISIAAWINVETKSTPYLGRIVIKNPGPDNIVYGIFHGYTNYIYAQLEDIDKNRVATLKTDENAIENSQWEFIVFTWDGDDLKIYINGNLIIWGVTSIFEHITSCESSVTIGNSENPDIITGIKGKIDDVRIYNRALTEDEISTLANSNSTNGIIETKNTLISVFPNPANRLLNITGLASGSEIKIYNFSGQMITKSIYSKNSIDVSGLINGIYLIEAYTENKLIFSEKFIKK